MGEDTNRTCPNELPVSNRNKPDGKVERQQSMSSSMELTTINITQYEGR